MGAIHIDSLMKETRLTSRHELIAIAAMVARLYNVSPANALRKIEAGEINIDDMRDAIITKHQRNLPAPKEEQEESSDDTTPQS